MLVLLFAVCTTVQCQQPGYEAEKPYVLHVYTNLVQLPTLVLDENMRAVPPIPKDRFEVQIDAGTPFRPTSLRREGNDPISLAILLDASGDEEELIKTFAESLTLLAPQYLHPQDHVSLFALDCKLIRSLNDTPADTASLQRGVHTALQAPGLHGEKTHGACRAKLTLRNALMRISQSLGTMPGRRVLVAVTDGHDGGSSVGWAETEQYVASQGVAVFGVRDVFNTPAGQTSGVANRRGAPGITGELNDEDLFRAMCESNGGLLISTTGSKLHKELTQILTDLRDRYILEFPRPDKTESGLHDVRVSVARTQYVVHTTGVSVSLPDPDEANDPNNVPVSKSPATFGTQQPVIPKY